LKFIWGYEQTNLECTGNATPLDGNTLTLWEWEDVTCTFTNDDTDTDFPTITNDPLEDISDANATSYPVSWVCLEDWDEITVVLTDANGNETAPVTTICGTDGKYSVLVDASGLDDWAIDIESTIDDWINLSVSDDDAVIKNTTLPSITQDLLIDIIATTDLTAYPVSGACTNDGDEITITLRDETWNETAPVTTTCGTDGTYSVTVDISWLDDGDIDSTSTIDDGVNPPVSDTGSTTQDTVLPTISHDTLGNLIWENGSAYPVSGACTNDGDTITVTITDGTNTTAPVTTMCSGGIYSVEVNALTLNIGAVTVQSVIDDGFNETATDITPIEKTFFISTGGGWSSSSSSSSTQSSDTTEEEDGILEEETSSSEDEVVIQEDVTTETTSETTSEETVVSVESEQESTKEAVEEITQTPVNLPTIEEDLKLEDTIVEIEYIPYTGNFILPTILPQTGTPLSERVQILENPLLSLTPPEWAAPDLSMTNTDITYWKDVVLPYAEDRKAMYQQIVVTIQILLRMVYR